MAVMFSCKLNLVKGQERRSILLLRMLVLSKDKVNNENTCMLQQPRMVGRGSQRGREPGAPVPPRSTSGRGGKIIIIQSTGREPKLKTTENAWKPSLRENSAASDDVQVNFVVFGKLWWFAYYMLHTVVSARISMQFDQLIFSFSGAESHERYSQ